MTLQEAGLLAGLIEKWTNIVTRQCCMKISLLFIINNQLFLISSILSIIISMMFICCYSESHVP